MKKMTVAEILAPLAAKTFTLECPACNEKDTIQPYTYAFASRETEGINEDGSIKLGEPDTYEYDDNFYECSNCSERFDEQEIADLIEDGDDDDGDNTEG